MNSQVDCPLCGKYFSSDLIESHVNTCLSNEENSSREEQLRRDAEYAASLQDEPQAAYSSTNSNGSSSRFDASGDFGTGESTPTAYALRVPTSISISKNNNSGSVLTKKSTYKEILPTGKTMLQKEGMKRLATLIPDRLDIKDFYLLYSCALHGTSLNTLFGNSKGYSPAILLIKDSKDHIFGAYITEPFTVRSATAFAGTGECFLFSLYPNCVSYKWTKNNAYYMLMSSDSLAVGCGDTGYGLWLDSDLVQGSSAPCETFGNPILSSAETFECMCVEVWGLPPATTKNW